MKQKHWMYEVRESCRKIHERRSLCVFQNLFTRTQDEKLFRLKCIRTIIVRDTLQVGKTHYELSENHCHRQDGPNVIPNESCALNA